MKKKYKRILIIILIVVLLAIISFVIYKILLNNKTEEEVVNVVDSISEYGYNLDDRDTELMKSTYEELKNILNSDEIDYELYANTLAKLFVIDLFTMDNKINKYDVGSTEYVYPDALENYKLNVEDTLYKHMENNSSGKRKQDLPEVSNIEVLSNETDEYTIEENSFDATIVQGDTMTVLCSALASYYKKIPVFHVEAGLRSYDIYEPFPEEIMRQMTTRVAELNFAPTEKNKHALLKENVSPDKIFVTGNTVIDALFCLTPPAHRAAAARPSRPRPRRRSA